MQHAPCRGHHLTNKRRVYRSVPEHKTRTYEPSLELAQLLPCCEETRLDTAALLGGWVLAPLARLLLRNSLAGSQTVVSIFRGAIVRGGEKAAKERAGCSTPRMGRLYAGP